MVSLSLRRRPCSVWRVVALMVVIASARAKEDCLPLARHDLIHSLCSLEPADANLTRLLTELRVEVCLSQ